MAVANLPFYSTSYGEGFGYNERDGSNTSSFRNRYLNDGYRGSADLGPVRFNATRAQATQNLAHVNSQRPSTAAPQRTQQQTAPFRPASAQAQAQTQRGGYEQQQQQQQQYYQPQQSQQYEEPRGVYTAPVRSSSRFSEQQGESVNERPYYVAPYERAPSNQYAPNATALGNKTYRFDTDAPNYAFSQSFRGQPNVSSRPLADPGQSIPFGRLQAEDARDVRLKMSLDSWDTFHVADRSGNTAYNLSGLRSKQLDSENYCKTSISRRLESGAQLRYHLPGYQGAVKSAQFRHGSTYGKTTRQCLSDSKIGL